VGFKKVKDHTGRIRIELSKCRPVETDTSALSFIGRGREKGHRNRGGDPKTADFADVYF